MTYRGISRKGDSRRHPFYVIDKLYKINLGIILK